jgi:hypothetical protein
MMKKINLVLILLLFLFVFSEKGHCVSQSQYALIKRPVFTNPEIWKLTKDVTNNLWGIDLYCDPRSSAQSYVIDPSPPPWTLLSGMDFNVDQCWNRIVYSECLDNWIRAYGTYGSETGQFNFPRRIEAQAQADTQYQGCLYNVYVLDSGNNRIVKLLYNANTQILTWDDVIIGGGLDFPIDMDLNNDFEFLYPDNDYLWVLNGDQIKRFTMDGVLHYTYGSYGCDDDTGHFCRPTAVVCGRSAFLSPPYDRYANDDHIYVADAGNNRIVWLTKWHGYDGISWYKTFESGECESFVDLEVDNFGQIWAVDKEDGRIYKYTSDLYPLCYFGSFGTGENQFYYPVSFSNTGGYLGCGDVFVAEAWTDSSGGQYFAIGTDVVDFFVNSSADHYWHFINYTLIDPSLVSIKIYNQTGSLVKTLFYGSQLSGACAFTWDGSNQSGQQVATGDYRIVLVDSSKYGNIETGGPVNVVTKEAWVHHEYNANPPAYIPGDCNGDGVVDAADLVFLLNFLFVHGPAPAPLCIADVTDNGIIDAGDLVYLMNYLYVYGSGPSNGCD